MSDYFNATGNRISDGVTARASDVNTLRDEVGSGFDLLPSVSDLASGLMSYATATGTANNILLAMTAAPSVYSDGMEIVFKATANNTGSVVVNVDGLGSKQLVTALGTTLVADDIVADDFYAARYNSTSGKFELSQITEAYLATQVAAAAASAVAADASETAAAASAAAALSSENNASASETAAAASETAAAASETAAAASETAAAASAVDAASYAAGVISPLQANIDTNGFSISNGLADFGPVAGGIGVSTGDSGLSGPSLSADDLVVESNGNVGITLAAPSTAVCNLRFGDQLGAAQGQIQYDHTDDSLAFSVNTSKRQRIDSTGRIVFGDVTSDSLGADAGAITISSGDSGQSAVGISADDLIIENDGNVGMSLLSPSTHAAYIRFGDEVAANAGAISYSHIDDGLRMAAGLSNNFLMGPTNLVFGNTNSDCLGAETGSLTISTGDSGVTGIATGSDDFIIENDGNAGMTIACPDTSYGYIRFADTLDNNAGAVAYDHNTDSIRLRAGGNTIYYQTATNIIFSPNINSDALGAEQGSVTISTGDSGVSVPELGADDLIIENDNNGGLSILTPNTNYALIYFGDPEDSDSGRIQYYHGSDYMNFYTAGSEVLRIESDGTLVAKVANYETLVTADDDIPNKKYVDDKYSWLVIAEENAAISTATNGGYQWSHGNGQTNILGSVIPVACEVTHLTFGEVEGTAITATVQLVKNGTPVAGATVALSAASSAVQVLGTPVAFAAGDRITFVTTVGVAQGAGGIVTALCRST